jgi:hypothetical protein
MVFTTDLTCVYSENTELFAEYMKFYIQRMCDCDAEYINSIVGLQKLYQCREIISQRQDIETLRALCSIIDNDVLTTPKICLRSDYFFEVFCMYFECIIGEYDDTIKMENIMSAYNSVCSPRIYYMVEMCIDMLHMNFNQDQKWMNEQFHSFELESRVIKEIANGCFSQDYHNALLKEAKTPTFDDSLILMMVKVFLHAYNQVVVYQRTFRLLFVTDAF